MADLMALKKLNSIDSGFTDQSVVVGSAWLQLIGIREANDLDVVVERSLWDKVRGVYGTTEGRDDEIRVNVDGTVVNFYYEWKPNIVTPRELRDSAFELDGIRYASWKHVLLLKACSGRKKDWDDALAMMAYTSVDTYAHQKVA